MRSDSKVEWRRKEAPLKVFLKCYLSDQVSLVVLCNTQQMKLAHLKRFKLNDVGGVGVIFHSSKLSYSPMDTRVLPPESNSSKGQRGVKWSPDLSCGHRRLEFQWRHCSYFLVRQKMFDHIVAADNARRNIWPHGALVRIGELRCTWH